MVSMSHGINRQWMAGKRMPRFTRYFRPVGHGIQVEGRIVHAIARFPRHLASCPIMPLIAMACLLALCPSSLGGAEIGPPGSVDVPDPIGLGERLALVDWLQQHGAPPKDANDLPALRRAYQQLAHPTAPSSGQGPGLDADPMRAEIILQIWKRHGRNADASLPTASLQAQLSRLDDERKARDAALVDQLQEKERTHDRASSPAPVDPGSGKSTAPALVPGHDDRWMAGSGERAQIFRYYQQTMGDVFAAHTDHAKPWYADAADFIRIATIRITPTMAADALQYTPLFLRGKSILDAGCDDPMFLYLYGMHIPARQDQAYAGTRAITTKALAGFAASAYPPARIFACAGALLAYSPSNIPRSQLEADPATKAILDVYLDAARRMVHEVPLTPLQKVLYSRWLGTSVRAPRSTYIEIMQEMLLAEVDRGPVDPWLAAMLKGQIELHLAWKCRGFDWAKEVAPEGWAGFNLHLANARAIFEPLWAVNQSLPDAACHLITVSMGQDHPIEERRLWFNRASTASPECELAYHAILNALLPRWGGSYEQMLEIGRAALATHDFNGEVPNLYLYMLENVIEDSADKAGATFRLFHDDEIWHDVVELFQGYTTSPTYSSLLPYNLNRYADCALAAKRMQDFKVILSLLGGNLTQAYFGHFSHINVDDAMRMVDVPKAGAQP